MQTKIDQIYKVQTYFLCLMNIDNVSEKTNHAVHAGIFSIVITNYGKRYYMQPIWANSETFSLGQ